MKRTLILIFGLILIGSAAALLSVQGAEADCTGGIHIYGCPDSYGCVVPEDGTVPKYFTTNGSGYAFVDGLCAGKYYVCVHDCGDGTFTSDGSSNQTIYVNNGNYCRCP